MTPEEELTSLTCELGTKQLVTSDAVEGLIIKNPLAHWTRRLAESYSFNEPKAISLGMGSCSSVLGCSSKGTHGCLFRKISWLGNHKKNFRCNVRGYWKNEKWIEGDAKPWRLECKWRFHWDQLSKAFDLDESSTHRLVCKCLLLVQSQHHSSPDWDIFNSNLTLPMNQTIVFGK